MAVVFCLSEVQWLSDAAKEDVQHQRAVVNWLPSNLCLFEKVSLLSLVASLGRDHPPRLLPSFRLVLYILQDLHRRRQEG